MPQSSPGPRDYTQGTERALFAFSRVRCYYPGCDARVVVFLNGEPVCNVQIAHVHAAKKGSERYDPSMTDDERRAFANLILLCTPHHTLVDRLHPKDYPAELLQQWKTEREADAGIDDAALSSLTEDRLVELIEKAVAAASPERLVSVELGLGVAMDGHLMTLPSDIAKDHFAAYTQYGPPVVILTVRNQGGLKAYVNGHLIRLTPSGLTFYINELPMINPPLPCALDSGESRSWFYLVERVAGVVKTTRALEAGSVDALIGEVSLGSGETVTSIELPAACLGSDC